ncbi:7-deoxyloganetin glucosyltransferase-like [Herrania umbratica]|uniref:7-deoxyloganetin glucosyltransferase-like n=1 Tax=Herrania umbratica TaxID=108875 RepID=A0A6J0ZWI4_9ROSI|nr:7-deoxyloganetin glucosyltransferase-like [Herrania umbratica]
MACNNAVADIPHAVCIPCPAQGHINPMLKLAKVLHLKGFHVTFVNTEYNHKRLLRSRGPNSLDGLPDFCFETIPDGLPPSDADATQDVVSLFESLSKNCLDPFRDLLYKLNDSASSNVPPVTCIIADDAMPFPMEAAEEFGITGVRFWPASASSYVCFAQLPRLVEEGLTPVTNASGLTNEYLDTVIDWMPGMKKMRFRDLPSFFRTTDPNDWMLNYLFDQVSLDPKASALIFNTFDSLEKDALGAISAMRFTPVYSIGPIHLLVDQIGHDKLKHIDSNLWKEEPECLKWLDTKEPNSVVYVNFGSVAVLTPQQLVEFAWGLANSKKQFLCIIRPDLVTGGAAILPPEFVSETKDRGMLASWCPQEQVLKHPSIGGFLSHMGWNSTIESISAGVPMLCLPVIGDQQTNCRFACKEWGIGMEIDNNVRRDQVEMLVRELMEGDKGVEMKANALEWKKKAEEASRPGGGSFENLDKLLTRVLLSDKHIDHLKRAKNRH